MDIRLKSSLSILGTGSTCTGACCLATKEDTSPWVSVSMDKGYKKTYSSDTNLIGNKYGKHLTGVYSDTNKGFWKTSYFIYAEDKRLNPTLIHSSFNSVTEYYSLTNSKSLNKVCEVLFKKNKSEIDNSTSDLEKQKLKQNLWKYCSPAGKELLMAKERKYSSKYYGHTVKDKLIDAAGALNDNYWKAKNDWFLAQKEPSDPYFQVAWHKGKENRSNKLHLKNRCGNAYSNMEIRPVNITHPSKKGLLKYCALEE